MKMKVSKIVFGNVSGVKDFRRLEKLINIYGDLKRKNEIKPKPNLSKKVEKIKAEINELMPEVEEELNRLLNIYGGAMNEMAEDNVIYSTETAKGFMNEIKKMQSSLLEYKDKVK